jgi:hypothetical protein
MTEANRPKDLLCVRRIGCLHEQECRAAGHCTHASSTGCTVEQGTSKTVDWPARLHIAPEGALRLLLEAVRIGKITVDEAMDCFKPDSPPDETSTVQQGGWSEEAAKVFQFAREHPDIFTPENVKAFIQSRERAAATTPAFRCPICGSTDGQWLNDDPNSGAHECRACLASDTRSGES